MKKTEKEYIKLLEQASDAYYNSEDTVMTDEEFDNLRDEFKALYPKSKYLKEVGAKSKQSSFKKVKHRIPMGSLLKTNTPEETKFFHEKYALSKEVCWSEKLDGLSISLLFEKGEFTQAITRGDGIEGEDVTENVRKMKFRKTLKSKYSGDIRAEIILPLDTFKKEFSDKANPRNAASGAVRRLDGERCEHLEVYCYYIDGDYKTEMERFDSIKSLGLDTPKHGLCKNFDEIQKVWERYEKKDREKAPYEIDGIVLFVNDVATQDELGIVDGRPRYARAYKFSAQSAVTEIEEVIWQVGRTGRITPVAKIRPVNVAGATISNVSLHNLAEIKRKNLQLNQVVYVERKGDVIPQITKSIGEGTQIEILKKCPSCDSRLVEEDIFLLCKNSKNCPEQEIQNLIFWITALDIKGFGDKMVRKLFEQGLVKSPSDFYSLKEEDIAGIERSGDRLAKKLITELHSKKEVEPELFIKAIGMEDFGEGVAKLILEKHRFQDLFSLTEEQLLDIHGIGEETAKKVVVGLKENKVKIKELLKIISLKEKKQGSLSGKSFCFTEVRDKELEKRIKEMGGVISDSVNKNLSYLIVKSLEGSSSKKEKAKKLNIPMVVITEIDKILE